MEFKLENRWKLEKSAHHVQNVLLSFSRSRQTRATCDIRERKRQEGLCQSLDLLLVQRQQHLLDESHVVVAIERLLVLCDDGSDGIGSSIVDVDVRQFVVVLRQRLHESADDLRRVLGDRDLLSAENQRHQDVLFVGFQHDVRHCHCWRGDRDFVVVQSPVVVLHGRVDHSAIVKIKQKVFGRGVLVVVRRCNRGDVDVEEAQCRVEQLRAQAELAEIGVERSELRLRELDLLDGGGQHLDALRGVELASDQEICVMMEQIEI